MLHIKNISMKNFLSYGEIPVKIEFDRTNMTVISAKNGNGKCVDRLTSINIEFQDDEIKELFLQMVNEHNQQKGFLKSQTE